MPRRLLRRDSGLGPMFRLRHDFSDVIRELGLQGPIFALRSALPESPIDSGYRRDLYFCLYLMERYVEYRDLERAEMRREEELQTRGAHNRRRVVTMLVSLIAQVIVEFAHSVMANHPDNPFSALE